MKNSLSRNILVAIATLFISLFDLPVQSQVIPVWIAGKQLTYADNFSNIQRDEILSGKVSFNPETLTLTLEDAVIETKDKMSITIKDSNPENHYTLLLKGRGNNIINGYMPALNTYSNLTIKGGGYAEMSSEYNSGIFVNNGATLTITDGCTVVTSGKRGFGNSSGMAETLVIDNANIRAVGNGMAGSITYFKEIKLKNCEITSPSGATIKDGSVMFDGIECTEEVVITPTASGIETTNATTKPAKRSTYTISGVKTNADFERLPKGIYIVDGVVKVKK